MSGGRPSVLYIEVLLSAVGLSMDGLAVSVTGDTVLKSNCTAGNIIKMASVLGIFQAGMTVINYTMGLGFEKYICAFDYWIAFTLLLCLGGKMIYDSTKKEEEDGKSDPLCNRTLCGLGITTSIGALTVGISLAILELPLLSQASTIGITTSAISAFDVYSGNRFGKGIDLKLNLIGGLVLIGIGTKILIEHLFFSWGYLIE